MTAPMASITLQLLMAHNYAMCGLYTVSNAHYDQAMDAIYWLECPTKESLRTHEN